MKNKINLDFIFSQELVDSIAVKSLKKYYKDVYKEFMALKVVTEEDRKKETELENALSSLGVVLTFYIGVEDADNFMDKVSEKQYRKDCNRA